MSSSLEGVTDDIVGGCGFLRLGSLLRSSCKVPSSFLTDGICVSVIYSQECIVGF